jgi:hypothetical protein
LVEPLTVENKGYSFSVAKNQACKKSKSISWSQNVIRMPKDEKNLRKASVREIGKIGQLDQFVVDWVASKTAELQANVWDSEENISVCEEIGNEFQHFEESLSPRVSFKESRGKLKAKNMKHWKPRNQISKKVSKIFVSNVFKTKRSQMDEDCWEGNLVNVWKILNEHLEITSTSISFTTNA